MLCRESLTHSSAVILHIVEELPRDAGEIVKVFEPQVEVDAIKRIVQFVVVNVAANAVVVAVDYGIRFFALLISHGSR